MEQTIIKEQWNAQYCNMIEGLRRNFQCGCGGHVGWNYRYRHFCTKKHNVWVDNQISSDMSVPERPLGEHRLNLMVENLNTIEQYTDVITEKYNDIIEKHAKANPIVGNCFMNEYKQLLEQTNKWSNLL